MILNFRFSASITYHNSFHGFYSGCGTGTASLEFKMLQQIKATREEVLNTIFLDLYKVYDTWKGPGAWRSWRDMVWGPGTSVSSEGIGRGYIWWSGQEGTM